MELRVLLGAHDVGVIRSQRDGHTEFTFSSDYLTASERPVLGQYFEDHLDEVHHSQTHLPAFFSNLLPEGGLRELIARRAGVYRDREANLIALLGEDLPGAVVVRRMDDPGLEPVDGPAAPVAGDPASETASGSPGALRFSLAGAQLKSREDQFHELRLKHFERLAEKVGVPADRVTRVVRDTIQGAMATWPTSPLDPIRLAALRAHVERLPLVVEAG